MNKAIDWELTDWRRVADALTRMGSPAHPTILVDCNGTLLLGWKNRLNEELAELLMVLRRLAAIHVTVVSSDADMIKIAMGHLQKKMQQVAAPAGAGSSLSGIVKTELLMGAQKKEAGWLMIDDEFEHAYALGAYRRVAHVLQDPNTLSFKKFLAELAQPNHPLRHCTSLHEACAL